MQSRSDKAIKIDGLIGPGGRLCHESTVDNSQIKEVVVSFKPPALKSASATRSSSDSAAMICNGDPIRPSKWHRIGRLCHGHVVLVVVVVVVVFARFDSDMWE